MNRDDLLRLLARERRRYIQSEGRRGLSVEEARAVLAAFDRGDLTAAMLPMSEEETRRTGTVTAAVALAALVAALRRAGRRATPLTAPALLAAMTAADRKGAAAGVFGRFTQSAAAPGAEGVGAWQRAHALRLRSAMAAGAALGRGGLIVGSDLAGLSRAVLEQAVRLFRFAGEIATRAAAGRPMSLAQIRARARMYRGPVMGQYYQSEARRNARPGVVVYFEGFDEGRSCSPCIDARAGSPYLPDDPSLPLPGVICSGGGHCHDSLRYVEDAEMYRQLAG